MAGTSDGGPAAPAHRRRSRWGRLYLPLIAAGLVVAIALTAWLRAGAGPRQHPAGAAATASSAAPADQHLASAPGTSPSARPSPSSSRTVAPPPPRHPSGATMHYIANLDGNRDVVAAL